PYNLPRRQIVYIPNDPASCFKEYPTAESFAEDMGERLTAADYQQFFVRFVPQRESLKFTETLRRRVDGAQMSGGGSQPNLSIALSLIHGGLFDHLFTAQLARIKDDAKVLAVPTADEDEKSRIERLHAYETAGIVLLNVAALFVPVLGEILLGVMAVQLSEEVFEGIEDWREGDRQEALSHLTNVVENLALAAAIGAGGKAASHLLKRSGFVEGLVPVNV
ncbi:DUF6543 domain-containing protein, partial [Paenibacillus polymyxa]|uniref:dermonecrotic toxin domain-containing protein n=1 Tax=Paenibacillus polymyxa TaxID=1406 RepID=UPI00307FB413